MGIRDKRLAVMQSDNVILRAQIAEITDVPGSKWQRLFLFRELNFGLVTYYALARKGQSRSPATPIARVVGNPASCRMRSGLRPPGLVGTQEAQRRADRQGAPAEDESR